MQPIAAIVSLITLQSATDPAGRAEAGPQTLVLPETRLAEWVAADPEAFWPYWAQGKGRAWTVTGLPGAMEEGLFGHDAAAGSTAWPFTLSVWVQDEATGRWIAAERRAPGEVAVDLRSGYLPIPRAQISGPALTLAVEYSVANAAAASFPDGVAVLRARVTNSSSASRRVRLVVAARPYLVDGRVGLVRDLRWERDVLWVNGSIPLAADRVPAEQVEGDLGCGGRDLSRLLLEGAAGAACEPASDLRAGAFVFPLTLGPRATESVAILAPLAPIDPDPTVVPEFRRLGTEELAARAAAHWRARLIDLPFQIADTLVDRALRASAAYALLGIDAGLPEAGAGDDGYAAASAPYLVAAFLRAGQTAAAAEVVRTIVPVGLGRAAPAAWDAPGRAIFALAEYARFTGDSALARRHWDAVRGAAERLRRARAPMAHDSMRGGPGFGIVPASVAPAHLSGGDGHHYWDAFWAIRGLRDAAALGRIAGRDGEARWMEEEAAALERAVRRSYRQVMLVTRIDWIPDGPEDVESASAARSTCAGLWPAAGLEPGDSIVRRSFDRYWERWLAPYGGAYLHRGRFWPVAFEIGLCEIWLDRPERAHAILGRHLARPTFPGTFAWAQQADTAGYRYAGGPLPDPWAAADYVNLVRAMLVYERGDTLVLGAGISPQWLREGPVEVRGAPTALGRVAYRVSAQDGGARVLWDVIDAGRAAAVRIAAPVGRVITEAKIDDVWTRRPDRARFLSLPPAPARVELTLAKP